jgi:hypothetical protein
MPIQIYQNKIKLPSWHRGVKPNTSTNQWDHGARQGTPTPVCSAKKEFQITMAELEFRPLPSAGWYQSELVWWEATQGRIQEVKERWGRD